jgi:hypothetical protein
MSGTFLDALQMGGASATILAVMFGVYKLLTLAINHRCRSDCCGRFFSLGIAVEETTPPPHRLSLAGEATLNHRLLDGFQLREKPDDTQSVFVPIPLRPLTGQKISPIENRNHWSGVVEDTSSPEPSHQSTSPPIQSSLGHLGSHSVSSSL